MQLQLKQLDLRPGQRVLLQNISWNEFEQILDELGDERATRVVYYKGMLEIMAPLLGHENSKEIIGDLVKTLLEELDIEFSPAGSTTFKRQNMDAGVEPDECFYIQNEAVIRGRERIDLNTDPPPDLAIEIDVTTDSKTKKNSYQALGVTELWIYDRGSQQLQINVLREGKYVESNQSQIFPGLPIVDAIPQYLTKSKVDGRNAAIKAFRAWLASQLKD